jgi:hypothetical protein
MTSCTTYNHPDTSPALSMPSQRTPALRSPVWLRPGPLRTCLCPLDAPQPWSSLWASLALSPRASVRHAPLGHSPNSHLPDDPLWTSLRLPLDDLWHLWTALTLDLHSYRNSPCLPLHQIVLRYSYNGTVQVHLRWVHVQRVHLLRHIPWYAPEHLDQPPTSFGVTQAPSGARSGCTL